MKDSAKDKGHNYEDSINDKGRNYERINKRQRPQL